MPVAKFAEWADGADRRRVCFRQSGLSMIDLQTIDVITGGSIGTFDVPCPLCGPAKSKRSGQRKPVLRIWRVDQTFATYNCARCETQGYARDNTAKPPSAGAIARAKAAAAKHERFVAAKRLSTARWLWSRRQPIHGTIAETYLRDARGYHGPIPPTLSFLPASDEHTPAMIAAFGVADEPEPGTIIIAENAIRGVHVTKLALDGSGKAGSDKDKITIGKCLGSPIVLAPPNDLMGMAVTEGIENGLSIFAATGLGVWAAGAASRMPMLADTIPGYIDCVTVGADADPTGLQNADQLLERIKARGLHGDLFVTWRST
jgi:hypothetical protein